MNIILLSGGSGKRLWPLSNGVRGKQFLKLFKINESCYESMLQRTYRQIASVDQEANIIVTAEKSQVNLIKKQLDGKVAICVEPCRKDTFPAIALAVAYMKYKMGMQDEECVTVCPIDSYVDLEYYKTIEKLNRFAQHSSANLFLIGAAPTYPSEKYGYILPERLEMISTVKEFKEKPDKELAREYISQGALWNTGVFIFRVGYLLKRAKELLKFKDYGDLYTKYSELRPISFDYAVVEKTENMQVFRYEYGWKDVGTWNTVSEVMSDAVKGNVLLDNTCENTQVINELDIPLLGMGCKNMVIVVTQDGILVANKESSGHIKSYVEKINTTSRRVEKPQNMQT